MSILGSGGEVVTPPPLNRKVGCSRPNMIRAGCLRVRQQCPARKNNQTGAQQRFAVMRCTARDYLFRRVILYRQVNNKPHVQIKPTNDHAKSYAAYRGMILKKPKTEVAR